MLLSVVHIRANGVTTYVWSFCFVMVFVLLICWDWILVIFSPLGIVFSYVFVLFCLDFFSVKMLQSPNLLWFFLVWSDVRRCLLPEFRSLIMMHSWRFQTLPGIGIRPVKKEGFYVISENINLFCTPLDVTFLQIYPLRRILPHYYYH